MKTVIHVNQHNIKWNHKNTREYHKRHRKPVITCKTYKSNDYADEVRIEGPCKVVYRPDKPLSCGAKVWIETESKITIL